MHVNEKLIQENAERLANLKMRREMYFLLKKIFIL
jgi:hypothetical protein